MSFSLKDFKKITNSRKKILLLTEQKPSLDAIASLLSISRILEKTGVKTDILLPDGLPINLHFLGENFPLIKQLKYTRDFVLIFNTEKNNIASIQTEKNEKSYLIRITPEKEAIHPRDFSFVPADFSYEWIITLGISNLGKIGQPYLDNPDLFFEVPKINIDRCAENELFGQINWIEETASSFGEMFARFFLEKQPEIIDQEISQLLLTSIVSGTESFQNPQTTPHAMILAAQLMKYGANQTEIVRYLYRNKSLPLLKLWGKIMARIEWKKEKKVFYSWLSKEDFLSNNTNKEDLDLILEEVQRNFPLAKIYAIFYINEKEKIQCQLLFAKKTDAEKICPLFQQEPQKRISIDFEEKTLSEARKIFLEKLLTD